MMQHALFVGQYMRVALALPLLLCHQADTVVQKRVRRMRLVTAAEAFFAIFLTFTLFVQVLDKKLGLWIVTFLWTLSSLTLALALIFAFQVLKKWQKKISGVFCNERLVNFHLVSFLTATIANVITFFLFAAITFDHDVS